MAEDQVGARFRVYNPVLNGAAIAVLVLFAAAALGGVLDPTDAVDKPDWWPGVVFVVVPLLLAARGLRVGVVVRDTDVVMRGWLRTRRLSREDVLAVKTRRYSGLWTRGGESRLFRMLAIKTSEHTVEVPAVAARDAKAERLAAALRRALAIAD